MTSKEALKELIIEQQKLVSTYADKDAKTSDEVMILYKTISKDLEVLEKLKKVLSNVSHGSSIMSLGEPDKNGLMNMTVQPKVSLGEEFDTAFFQCILDELGFELFKKETESK